ncbi:hypothetical protein BV898_18983 [Hypsibius exemplaris]|uniref:Uncharacterized protein n=1 Tax=Hypsibius exemplaris TaxID=2072580 RepID=A0A9X6NKM5_HYPEX|nr:hypothetical protein BV898_18983 [Hypsibius exemplaris]
MPDDLRKLEEGRLEFLPMTATAPPPPAYAPFSNPNPMPQAGPSMVRARNNSGASVEGMRFQPTPFLQAQPINQSIDQPQPLMKPYNQSIDQPQPTMKSYNQSIDQSQQQPMMKPSNRSTSQAQPMMPMNYSSHATLPVVHTNTVVLTTQPNRTVMIEKKPKMQHWLHCLITVLFPPWLCVWIILCIVNSRKKDKTTVL